MTANTEVEPLVLERDEGAVRWITLNRPAVHNALNRELFAALSGALDRVDTSTSVRVVVITGAGDRSFCAGADLDELVGLDVAAAEAVLEYGQRVINRLEGLRRPVIAAVNGLALGGGFELALACTLVMASETAAFGLPETGLGLMPGYGGTQRLPTQIGAQASRLLVLSGERMGAEDALRAGLLALPPSPGGALHDDVMRLATQLATRGPKATAFALEALRVASDVPLAIGLRVERQFAAMCIVSEESAEGVAAFRARRTPRFEPADRA